jgi:CO/xanthine dehydrogenase FAD-binding subunit
LDALAGGGPKILAGGTDFFPTRVVDAPETDIIDISALPDLRRIEMFPDHARIPALATWSDVIEAGLHEMFDGLVAAARQVGGAQIQNAGTVVGNLVNASPAADGIPCLLALDAEVEIASARRRRIVPVDDFVLGARKTVLEPDELVIGLRVPLGREPARATFEKLGARRYLVISIVMVAAIARFAPDGRIADARVAVGSCHARAQRLPALEHALRGAYPDPAIVDKNHLSPLAPIDDIRASAAYRDVAALELVRRAIAGLAPPQARAA